MNKEDYCEILEGVLSRASINQEIEEFKRGLEKYSYEELRGMIKKYRINHFLTEDDIELKKANMIDSEMTKRLLGSLKK